MDTAIMSSVGTCNVGADICQHSKQHNPPTIQSVIELRKGTTGRNNFQPHFSNQAAAVWPLLIPTLCCSPLPQTVRWHIVMKKMTFFRPFLVLLQIFMFCLWAWFISMFGGLNSRFGNVSLHGATAARFWGWDSTSLDVAVVIRAVRLRHIHLSHGLTHVIHPVLARWHALVDAVQALGLLEAGDLVLGWEPTDSWKEKTHIKVSGSPCNSTEYSWYHVMLCISPQISKTLGIY